MRNPNGYGGITKLPGNRRKPYRVRVTDGWEMGEDGKSRQIYRTIGYYESKEAAMESLAQYNKFSLSADTHILFSEVYNRWSAERYPQLSASSIRSYRISYDILAPLHNRRFAELKLIHLQSTIDASGRPYSMLEKTRVLLSQLYAYAMKHDICVKDYSEFIDISKYKEPDTAEKHKIFSAKEVQNLWKKADSSVDIRAILLMICSGLRIGELLDLKKEDVFLDERYLKIHKAKTKAGIRIVPIAEVAVPLWEEFMRIPGDYVIANSRDLSRGISYPPYLTYHYEPAIRSLGDIEHFPHDCRYTFISIMTAAKIQPVIIKRIVGHQSNDVTERVYTHFEIQQLVRAVNTPDFRNPFMEDTVVV